MSYSLEIHPLVQKDYSDVYGWYEDKKKGLGEKFMLAVRLRINAILSNPENYGSTTNKKNREASLDVFLM